MPGKKKGGSSDVKLAHCIYAHSWNGDYSKVAVAVGKEVWIFSNCSESSQKKWEKEHVLAKHDLDVSGVDWCPSTNSIVTCSHDRNAFVWNYSDKDGEWKPKMVILRISRAALMVKWSHDGQKFAVPSGDKQVPVCTYDPGQAWWVADKMKKHKSAVVTCDWHPNNQLLATGSTDCKCRVLSTYYKSVDAEQDSGPFEAKKFGEVLVEFACEGWVNSVAWSPSGKQLCYAGQDSSVHVVEFGENAVVSKIRTQILPFNAVLFPSEELIIASGFNNKPYAITQDGDGDWNLGASYDKEVKEKKKSKSSARAMFQKADNVGKDAKDATLASKHQAQITSMKLMDGSFSSTGIDGRLFVWKL